MKYLNAAQAAKRIGISDKTIRRWLKEGKISAIRTDSNQLMIPESEVEAHRRQRAQFVQSEEEQDTSSHDQSDMDALVSKVAELEQKIAALEDKVEKPIAPIAEKVIESPISTPPIEAISTIEVPQISIVEPKKGKVDPVPDDLPQGTIKVTDFIEMYAQNKSSFGRWINEGLGKAKEKIETTIDKKASGMGIQHYLTPDQQEKALDFLERHDKLDRIPPEADTFAEKHGIATEVFQEQMLLGLGTGTVPGEQTDPVLPVRDRIEFSERPKPGHAKEKERYLTTGQQHQVLLLWKKHKVPFKVCGEFGCWCHETKNGD